MIDLDYYTFAPKFDKDAPTFKVTGTGERVRLCYDESGRLRHKDNNVLCHFEDGRELLVGAEILTVEKRCGE